MANTPTLIGDSILPMPLQIDRFHMLESLLGRFNSLPKHTIVMLFDLTPASALAYFADMFSLFGDGWQFAGTEEEQRELIKQAIEVHRHKGTPWAIKRVLELLGYGDLELEERFNEYRHDGTIKRDGTHRYGSVGSWTHYRLITPRLITQLEAERIRELLIDVAPLRCKLVSIKTKGIYHNSTAKHDGTHTYDGVIARWQI